MKKFSAPPMIIILDVLFVVLFILVLESSPNLKIILPKDVYLEDMVVVTVDKNKKIQHYFNREEQKWNTFKEFKSHRDFNFILGNIDCNSNNFCQELSNPFENEEKRIYLKGDLYDQISGMIADSCLKFPKQCSNVTYHITKDGVVDEKRLIEEHQIFRHILLKETNTLSTK